MNSADVRFLRAGLLVLVLGGSSSLFPLTATHADRDDDAARRLCLTILHNNDGESQLLNAGSGLEDFGGADRFVTVVRQQRRDARRHGCAALMPQARGEDEDEEEGTQRGLVVVSSGDNLLAGPEFSASLEKGVPFYDSIVVTRARYDALALGNHEFDLGPDVPSRSERGFDVGGARPGVGRAGNRGGNSAIPG